MNIIPLLLLGTALAALVNLPSYTRERRLLEEAKERLELARGITALDRLLLSREKSGRVRTSTLYQAMLQAQYYRKPFAWPGRWRKLPGAKRAHLG